MKRFLKRAVRRVRYTFAVAAYFFKPPSTLPWESPYAGTWTADRYVVRTDPHDHITTVFYSPEVMVEPIVLGRYGREDVAIGICNAHAELRKVRERFA